MENDTRNDPLVLLDRLAARARQHAPQPLSVAEDVVRQLRQAERSPLMWMTACAVVATLLVLVFVGAPQPETDSLETLFQAANFIQTEGGF